MHEAELWIRLQPHSPVRLQPHADTSCQTEPSLLSESQLKEEQECVGAANRTLWFLKEDDDVAAAAAH